jgi:two-component system response regulator DesR
MRILVADGRKTVRFALRVLLEQQNGFKVVGETDSAEELLNRAQDTCPDLLLLGWELPGLVPMDSMVALRRVCPGLRVIALSGLPEARHAALEAGVDAFVSKGEPPERLLTTIDKTCCD